VFIAFAQMKQQYGTWAGQLDEELNWALAKYGIGSPLAFV